jgi:hypothetical protein
MELPVALLSHSSDHTMTITPEFTTQQAQAAIALFDIAVKAGGLNVAAQALEIAQIIQAAMQADQQPKEHKHASDD